MKIYAKSREFSFKNFIGKDVWLKCIRDNDVRYLRFVNHIDDLYYVNRVDDSAFTPIWNHLDIYNPLELMKVHAYTNYSISQFKYSGEALTTEEIIELLRQNNNWIEV